MLRFFVSLLVMLLIAPIQAQIEEEPVVFPVPGQMIFNRVERSQPPSSTPVLLDTFTGAQEPIANFGKFDSSGKLLIFADRQELFLTDVTLNTTQTINPAIEAGLNHRYWGVDWSGDSKQILYGMQFYSFADSVIIPLNWRLEIFNLQNQSVNVVLDIPAGTPTDQVFSIPSGYTNVIFETILRFNWNPIHPDWVVLHILGNGKNAATGEDAQIIDAGLFNLETKQFISFTTVFPQTVISFTDWNSDGTKIAMNTMTGITIVQFELQAGVPQLKVIADGLESNGQAVLEWLGPGDLLLTGIDADGFYNTKPYPLTFIADVIDGQWYSQEFLTDTQHLSPALSGDAFFFTGTDEEAAQLSCMFYDKVNPSNLNSGKRARITFTDGTPSRLRADPGTEAAVITQMAEGTEFEIIGSAYCVDGYRWWPLQLENGTTGWAAEGTTDEFWLEPVQ